MKLIVSLLFIFPAFAANADLFTSCFPCAIGEEITITGSGFKGGNPHNQLTVIVWGDDTDSITCESVKSGDFTCVTTITTGPGWYNVVAYSNSKTVIGVTSILVQ